MNATDLVDKLADNISIVFNRLPEMIEAMRGVARQNEQLRLDLDKALATIARQNDAAASQQDEIEGLRTRLQDEFKRNVRMEQVIATAGQALRQSPEFMAAAEAIANPVRMVEQTPLPGLD
jgi:hypothetical protein